jgi:hypothetical protein
MSRNTNQPAWCAHCYAESIRRTARALDYPLSAALIQAAQRRLLDALTPAAEHARHARSHAKAA